MASDNYFIHLPLRIQLSKFLPTIPEASWRSTPYDSSFADDVSNARLSSNIKSKAPTGIIRLTMTLHADEVGCSKSSTTKIFPIFVSINELKAKERRKFFFMVGLYVGKTKPAVEIYLEPICEEISSLSNEPMNIQLNGRNESQVTCHLTGIIADAPMRAYLRNVRQYNANYGCDWCLIQASSTERARVYTNQTKNDLDSLKRTTKDFHLYRQKYQQGYSKTELELMPRFKGITGVSPLLLLDDFDIVQGVSVEPMHSISLGVFKNFILKGVLSNKFANIFDSNINRSSFVDEISRRLLTIKVPSETARITRGLDQISYWKSNEFDSFLSYFFFTTTRGLLRKRIIDHISCLTRLNYLAHMGPASPTIIQEIDNLVEEFQTSTADIFKEPMMTYNLHILSHLSESIQLLGPNSSVSSYPLEDHMGKLKDKVRRFSNVAPSLLRVFLNDLKYSEHCEKEMKKWNLNQSERKHFGLEQLETKITKIRKKVDSVMLIKLWKQSTTISPLKLLFMI